ncbi:serine/threonine-protein kinase S6KL [Sabethes cyaneus]|uniref:serine/threonine-protein kinase S6KL n=1 Tax=Sabethes cyaneus TaxID=53552 RepID=UPI00237E9426|nr:serine/threonine-protein kinase S6KL [Sabethes cyaneus]
MGNASSSSTIIQSKEESAAVKPSSTLSPSSSSSSKSSSSLPSSLLTIKEPKHPRQIRIRHSTSSLDGVLGRFNESFHKFSSSLSCSALPGVDSKRKRQPNSNIRPWCRVSRRRWHESTLASEHLLSKTCWPVTNAEAFFLPHFPVNCNAERHYRFLDHIANGAFGKVYKVQTVTDGDDDDDKKTVYALKVLSKAEIINGSAIKQLKDEVDIQTVCGHHPFLAKCVRYWQTKKKIYLLSHFYPNGELFQKLKDFPRELVRLYVAEIALALDFLHQAGIIYRDLKPENVLLDQDYHIRLIDFGLSKWLSIGSRTQTLCGTLQYMAPELLSGEPYGHAIDWWAMGVLACRMYTGEYPELDLEMFLNKSNEIDKLIQGGNARRKQTESTKLLPESVSALPPEEQDLLRRLLETKPQYRLRSVLQLQRIALYKDYNWDAVRTKQISPKQLIEMCTSTSNRTGGEAVARSSSSSFDFNW